MTWRWKFRVETVNEIGDQEVYLCCERCDGTIAGPWVVGQDYLDYTVDTAIGDTSLHVCNATKTHDSPQD